MTVQGFGNVGSHLAVILSRLGVSTIAVGDHIGLPAATPRASTRTSSRTTSRSTARSPATRAASRSRARSSSAEGRHLRALRARESDRRERGAARSTCKLVVEGANGPCNPEGEKILLERGIDILPDVLANSGGVTVSYYEWVQNKRSESWTEEEVDAKLEKAMKRAYREVADFARQNKVDRRIAAYAIALPRIEAVYKEREIFP